MKPQAILKVVIAATFVVLLFGGATQAQTFAPTTQSQSANVTTVDELSLAEPHTFVTAEQVRSMEQAAMRTRVATQVATVAENITKEAIDLQDLEKNGRLFFSRSASVGNSLTQEYSLNVVVKYEARPIGGILTVRTELAPAFSGIGISIRPAIVRETSQAVDNLDQTQVGKIISTLTKQLTQDYVAG